MTKPADPLWKRLFIAAGSLKLATVIFILLGVLTFAGTWEQQHMNLYDVQVKYFESYVLVWWAGGVVPVPLFGAYLLLKVLFVNLLIGGVIRLKFSFRTIFVLIAHLGILSLLAGSLIEFKLSQKGQMRLFENDTGNEFQSSHEWEILISAPRDGVVREYIIPWSEITSLGRGEQTQFTHAELPFKLTLSDYARNAQPQPARPGDDHAIDGFVLARLKPEGIGGRVNVPAVIASLHPLKDGRASRSILWGLQDYPWDVRVDGERYLIDLRRRTWEIPFSVRLDRFKHERHPGMSMAKSYESFVTKIEGNSQERVHIKMNEPLRAQGYTLYQSGYGPQESDPPGTPPYSIFSVVKNPSDMWPKLMLFFVIMPGLLLHFVFKLARFLSVLARRRAVTAALVLLCAGSLLGCSDAEASGPEVTEWPSEVISTVKKIPVQAEGRVKPLSTWAAFGMLSMNHKRSLDVSDDQRIKPTQWFLEVALRPEQAKKLACFNIQTDEILIALGLSEVVHRKKRDRYSYEEIVTPASRARLAQLAEQFRKIDPKERERVQAGVVDLESSVALFEGVLTLFDWARLDHEVTNPAVQALLDGRTSVSTIEILEKAPILVERLTLGMGDENAGVEPSEEASAIGALFMRAFAPVDRGLRIGLFPPAGEVQGDGKTWLTMRDIVGFAFMRGQVEPEHLNALRGMHDMARAQGADVGAGATAWQESVRGLAEARGEYDQIEREVHYYALDPFFKSLGLFLLAFVLLAFTWLKPDWRWLYMSAVGLMWISFLVLTYGIVLRCIIRGRPPISTLYETVLFVTASGVVSLLVLEHLTRRRIAIVLVPILGALGLFVAGRYEVLKGTDTMPQLVAVLDTNYWLALHVTCITYGYGAGLVAAFLAKIYVLTRAFRGDKVSKDFYRIVGTMTYGAVCFALLLSLVGTILGGVWANDSWGRFWGWDPKENGALLIVLSQLAILHARMAGWIKAFGVCMATIFQGAIVAFSWWGVNLLGIGLHSYGFTSGIFQGLMAFYCLEGAVLLVGAYAWLRDSGGSPPPPPPPELPPPGDDPSSSS